MLDLKFIREHAERVIANTRTKHEKAKVEDLLELDAKRRALVAETDSLKNQRNVASEAIA
ncbi:MAG: serine--tRNA ligase, partial [Candidatus Kapaibacterium sp.]